MASPSVRASRALRAITFASLIATAGGSAQADFSKMLPDVPRFKLFASSHSTAAAEVLAFHGVRRGLPNVVLVGGLEGRIYRCDCGKDIHLWDIAQGSRLWAAAEGLKVATEARVLRGQPASSANSTQDSPMPAPENASPQQSSPGALSTPPVPAAGSTGPSQARAPFDRLLRAGSVPHSDGHRLDFADYRKAIDAGQPVVLTYSLDAASAKGMEASFRSQERVSVVGVGYEDSDSGRYVVAMLPEGVGGAEARTGGSGKQEKERDRFRRLMAMPGVKKGDREGVLLIPWELTIGNLIATFVTVE